MTLQLLRRVHLYLGLALMPWMLMYGASIWLINHQATGPVAFVRTGVIPFDVVPANTPGALHELGARMMSAAGVSGGFFATRTAPDRFVVNGGPIRQPVRLTYDQGRQQLTIERRQLGWRSFLVSLHTRSPLVLRSAGNLAWAAAVDVAALALLGWLITGLVMWRALPAAPRRWGWLALAGGVASFSGIVLGL